MSAAPIELLIALDENTNSVGISRSGRMSVVFIAFEEWPRVRRQIDAAFGKPVDACDFSWLGGPRHRIACALAKEHDGQHRDANGVVAFENQPEAFAFCGTQSLRTGNPCTEPAGHAGPHCCDRKKLTEPPPLCCALGITQLHCIKPKGHTDSHTTGHTFWPNTLVPLFCGATHPDGPGRKCIKPKDHKDTHDDGTFIWLELP